jgi:hypothetical protein
MTNHPTPVDDPADFPNDTNDQSTDKLIHQGTQLVKAVGDLRKAVERQRRTQALAIVLVFVAIVLLGCTIAENHQETNKLKSQFCGVVVGIVPGTGDPLPPAGPEGERARDLIRRFRVLASDFDCTLRP